MRFVGLVALLGLAAAVGCGGGDGKVDVSGAVTFNGEPVDDGSIQFAGEGADAATVIIAKGRYTARVTRGKKKVVIEGLRKTGTQYRDTADKSTAYDKLENFLPPEFNTQTKLTADVTGATDKLDFSLTGKDQLGAKGKR